MKLKPLILALIMTLTALASISVQASGPDCDPSVQDPANPVPVLPEEGTACTLVIGPGGVSIQGGPSASRGLCFRPDGFPLNCDPTEPISGFGAAVFNVTNWNTANGGSGAPSHNVDVWVEFTGELGQCGVAGFFCGFGIELCQDKNDDEVCDGDDSTHSAFAADNQNHHPLGDDSECEDKDTKDPCTGLTAEIANACVNQDFVDGNNDGSWDDLLVFISTWIGVNDATLELIEPKDYINAGIAIGQFDVTVHDDGANAVDCNKVLPMEPFICRAVRKVTVAAVTVDSITADCDGKDAMCTVDDGARVRTTPPDALHGTRTVTCGAGTRCIPGVAVEAFADQIVGSNDVTAEIRCAGSEVMSGGDGPGGVAFDDTAGVGADKATGTKVAGAFTCVITFDWSTVGNYHAFGICQDEIFPDPALE